MADGKAEFFDGDIDDYKHWLAQQQVMEKSQEKNQTQKTASKNDRAQGKAERQARLAERRPLVKAVEKLERDMAHWQQEKAGLETRLADSAIYEAANKDELQSLLKRQAEVSQAIELAEEQWLEMHAQLEALPEIA